MKDKFKNKNIIIGCLCATVCEFLFGLSYIFTKNATNQASAFSLLGWRFFVAFLAINICVLCGLVKINFKGKNILKVFAVALSSPVVYFIGETIGISNTTASESGIFLACIPVFSLIASTLLLHKKPTKMQIVGICVTLAGVVLTVVAVGLTASFSIKGYVFLFVAVIGYVFYSIFVDKAGEFNGGEITYVMLLGGAVVFCSVAFIEAGIKGTVSELVVLPLKNKDFLLAVLYQGLCCSVFAFFLSNVAISKLGVNRASSFIGVSTIASILSGIVFLHEKFSLFQTIGAIIIIAGVYLANLNFQAKDKS